jgi:tetratricopeptide (TPR) repeat protein
LGQQAGVPLQTAPLDYSKAIACYQQNLELARLSRDDAREGYALNNLGATYYAIGDYEKAISYQQQRLAQAESRPIYWERDKLLLVWELLTARLAIIKKQSNTTSKVWK